MIRTKRRRASSPAFLCSVGSSFRRESWNDLVLREGVSPVSLICVCE